MSYLQFEFYANFKKELTKIKRKDAPFFKKISKQLTLFQNNQEHPSLRLHKLSGNLKDVWSISVTKSIRIVFYYLITENERKAIFIAIGTHEEVYK